MSISSYLKQKVISWTGRKEDLHISILKYGRDEAENGVFFKDLSKHIKDKGYDVSDERLKAYFGEAYEPMDLSKRKGSYDQGAKERSALTIESTFRLIEYEELQNANSSSFYATVFAIVAIIISIFATCKSIYYSEKQLNSDVSINQNQINEIKSLKYDDKNLGEKIDSISSNMEIIIKQNKDFKEMTLQKNSKANNALNTDAQKARAR